MKKLLILSGKGGTGKTTTAAAFARFADARAIADCDVDAPNLHLVLGQSGAPEKSAFLGGMKAAVDPGLCTGCGICAFRCRFKALRVIGAKCVVNEFACEGCGVCAAVCRQGAITLEDDVAGSKELFRGADNVFSTATLKMGRGNSGKLVAAVKTALNDNAPDTDLAIIDGSPGIGCPVIASMSGVDLALIVAEPSRSGLNDLERLVETARQFRTRLAVCVNKWEVSPTTTHEIERFCAEEGLPFVGKIPYDKNASAAINAGKSIAEVDCPARDALKAAYDATMDTLFER